MKNLLLAALASLSLFAASDNVVQEDKLNCEVGSERIVCTYSTLNENADREYVVKWFDPNGKESRLKYSILPAGHSSFYDYRFLPGRLAGNWTVTVFETGFDSYVQKDSFIID